MAARRREVTSIPMRAALQGRDGSFRLVDVPTPAFGPAEALIRVRGAGICGSDLKTYGGRESAETTPAGHEIAGEIVRVGRSISQSRVGERVAIESSQGGACGQCWYCRIGYYGHCQSSTAYEVGGFAEFVNCGAAGCYPLPDNLSWEEGALTEPLAVSVHGLRRGRLSGGETVVVLGTGSIGLCTVAAAQAMGAAKVFATARFEHQAAMARLLGARDVFPPDGNEVIEAVRRATDGRGSDLTIETVGRRNGVSLAQAVAATREMGRIVVLGGFKEDGSPNWDELLNTQQTIIPSGGYGVIDGRHDYEVAIDLMASGRIHLGQIVTHRFPLGKIRQAFETAANASTGSIKVQILS